VQQMRAAQATRKQPKPRMRWRRFW
jgi:hypothetical protein